MREVMYKLIRKSDEPIKGVCIIWSDKLKKHTLKKGLFYKGKFIPMRDLNFLYENHQIYEIDLKGHKQNGYYETKKVRKNETKTN